MGQSDTCDADGCDDPVHTLANGATVNYCNTHFLQEMSGLRPNGEFEPQ